MRKSNVASAMRTLCELRLGKMGYPDAEVACYLEITNPSVNRVPVSGEIRVFKNYTKILICCLSPGFYRRNSKIVNNVPSFS